jgi:formyl-CoA transferase
MESAGGPTGGSILKGHKVIDLTHHLAGPWCTMILGDLGADVVKIESKEGDSAREYPPMTESGDSGAFLTTNRNKRSIAIDLRRPEGRDLVLRLAAEASVFVQNFRPGAAERLGLSYEALSAINPRIVYCNISGFGQTGPRAEEGGRDLVAQAMSGLMSVTGFPGSEPAKVGVPLTDLGTGLYATIGILGALIEAERTGKGQQVAVSLFETSLNLLLYETVEYFFSGRVPQPVGSGHRLSAPYQAYPGSDGYFIVCAESARNWPIFCEILGVTELMSDPRFLTNELRVVHVAELAELIAPRTRTMPTSHWIDLFVKARIPAARVNSVPEALDDPQAKARGIVIETDHPRAGRVRSIAPAIEFGRTPATIRRHAPALSENADEILAEMGLDEAAIGELKAAGVVL